MAKDTARGAVSQGHAPTRLTLSERVLTHTWLDDGHALVAGSLCTALAPKVVRFHRSGRYLGV